MTFEEENGVVAENSENTELQAPKKIEFTKEPLAAEGDAIVLEANNLVKDYGGGVGLANGVCSVKYCACHHGCGLFCGVPDFREKRAYSI